MQLGAKPTHVAKVETAVLVGHSIGVAFPPDWGERMIGLRQGDRTVLQPSHVVHAILGMWMEGWGIEVSETILITERGGETPTRFPRETLVKNRPLRPVRTPLARLHSTSRGQAERGHHGWKFEP